VLDQIAYARVFPDLQPLLADYVESKVTLEQLFVALQNYRLKTTAELERMAAEAAAAEKQLQTETQTEIPTTETGE
jgi:hypothetical protein